MIIFQCDKKGCDLKISLISYYQTRHEEGKPQSGLFIPLTLDETENLRNAIPGNLYTQGKSVMLCKEHSQERTLWINKRNEEFIVQDAEWLNTVSPKDNK
jgi:hypothetical protein